jgi:hypothetical protein
MRHLIQEASASQSDDFTHSRQKGVGKLETMSKYYRQILFFEGLGFIDAVFVVHVACGFDGPASSA